MTVFTGGIVATELLTVLHPQWEPSLGQAVRIVLTLALLWSLWNGSAIANLYVTMVLGAIGAAMLSLGMWLGTPIAAAAIVLYFSRSVEEFSASRALRR